MLCKPRNKVVVNFEHQARRASRGICSLAYYSRLGRTKSYHNFCLPPLQRPFWSSTMRVIAKREPLQQIRACGFFYNDILCFTKIYAHIFNTWLMTIGSCHGSPHVLRPAKRDVEQHASLYTCLFLLLSHNLGQWARGWPSAHVPNAPHAWKQLTSFIHISDLSLVRCIVPKSQEFVSEGIFSTVSLLLRTATSTGSQCALHCPSPLCLLWTVPQWSQCAAGSERLCKCFAA